MVDRLSRLEKEVAGLLAAVRRLEDRLASVEAERRSNHADSVMARAEPSADEIACAEAPDAAPLKVADAVPLQAAGESAQRAPVEEADQQASWEDVASWFSGVLPLAALTGRVCLLFCGGFLLRALTDEGVLQPASLGLSVGFVYATAWLILVDRFARKGDPRRATFYGAASVMMAYPLIWEATTKFDVLSPGMAFLVSGLVTTLAMGIAWLRSLRAFAWVVTLMAPVAAVAIFVTTKASEPCVVLLLYLGTATVWISYHRDWRGLSWPVAIVADGVVFAIVAQALHSRSLAEAPAELPLDVIPVLAVSLFLVYLANFTVQTLLRRQDVRTFEMVQTIAALVVGVGGAVRLAESNVASTAVLGAVIAVLAALSYAVAFVSTEMRWERRHNFIFYTWLGLVLTVTGCLKLTEGSFQMVTWCVLGVAVAMFGALFRRLTLNYHSAVYVVLAAGMTGLLSFSFKIFQLPTWEAPPELTVTGVLALVSAIVSYLVMTASPIDPDRPWSSRIPRLAVVVLAVVGAGAAAVFLVSLIIERLSGASDAAVLASIRTAVLATSAVLLGVAGRSTRLRELRWLVIPVLAIGGLKLLVEALPEGRATTLFPAFAFYGIALILTPRLLGTARRDA